MGTKPTTEGGLFCYLFSSTSLLQLLRFGLSYSLESYIPAKRTTMVIGAALKAVHTHAIISALKMVMAYLFIYAFGNKM